MPVCSRLQGFGETLLLQQCREQRANITAKETTCGFQPFFSYNNINCTIGMDGWSIHPFSDCFWQTHLVNINGKPYMWIHTDGKNEWIEQKPNLHSTNLELIAEFEELPLNDFDFTLKAHPAHETSNLEQLNILNDLMGRIQETNTNSFSTVVITESKHHNISQALSWLDYLKIMVLSVIGFIFFLICVRIFIALNPFPKLIQQVRTNKNNRKRNKNDIEMRENVPMLHTQAITLSSHVRPTAPTSDDEIHSHNHCSYVVGKGLVWEDLCPCDPTK
jgi:hypothetical protein